MNGFTIKVTTIIVTLLFAALTPALLLAKNTDDKSNKMKMYQTKLGCMNCHQAESTPPDEPSKDNQE